MSPYLPDPSVPGGPAITANPALSDSGAAAMRELLVARQGPTDRQQSSLLVQWDRILQFIGANPFDNTRVSYDQMYQMRRDAIVNLGLHLTYVPVILADWYVKCKRADVAAFVDGALRRIWPRFVLGALNSLAFGHSPGVKRFYLDSPDWTFVDPEDPTGQERFAWDEGPVQAAVWDDFVWLAPEKCWPRWDSSGSFGGMRYAGNIRLPGAAWIDQVTDGPAQTDIDLQHSIWVVNEQDFTFDSIWGWPRTGYTWKYFWAHEYLWALANRFYERHADPALVGYHPDGFVRDPQNPGPDSNPNTIHNSQRMIEILQSIRSGSNVAMPSDLHQSEVSERLAAGMNARQWYIEQLEVKGNPQWFSERFNELNIGKLRSVLAPEQSVIPGESGQSSRNVAQTLQQNVNDVAAFTVLMIDVVVNKFVIPDLVRANFPDFSGSCEKCTVGFTEQDVTAARQVLQLVGQTDPMAFNLDLDEVCRILGLPQLDGTALRAWQQRYINQAEKLAAAKVPPMGGNAGVQPAMGNGGGLAPGLNGQQLVRGLQAGEVEMRYVGDRPRISMAMEDVWRPLELVRCSELPVDEPGIAACVWEGKAYVLDSVSDEQASKFALLAAAQGGKPSHNGNGHAKIEGVGA